MVELKLEPSYGRVEKALHGSTEGCLSDNIRKLQALFWAKGGN
jgi:hypothetical protein